MILTKYLLMRVICESNTLYVLGIIIASDTNIMNCTFFETLSATDTDTVFVPVCDVTHMLCVWAVFEYAAVAGNSCSLVNYTVSVKYSPYCSDRTRQLKYSRVFFYDDSLLDLLSSWTERSRPVVRHLRNSSVLSLLTFPVSMCFFFYFSAVLLTHWGRGI
jgi:hypothetical protein